MRSESTRFLGQPRLTNEKVRFGDVMRGGGLLVEGLSEEDLPRRHALGSHPPSMVSTDSHWFIADGARKRQAEGDEPEA
jgi:hypothetical protein